jgi:hypothetical protein
MMNHKQYYSEANKLNRELYAKYATLKMPIFVYPRKHGYNPQDELIAIKCCGIIQIGAAACVPANVMKDFEGNVTGYELVYGMCCLTCHNAFTYTDNMVVGMSQIHAKL